MTDKQDLLIEIGTEELPPKALNQLSEALLDGVCAGLEQHQLHYHIANPYATPRRLALLVKGLDCRQADQTQERRGPALQAAYAPDGQPSKAALGFAKSCKVDISQLSHLETDKGTWLVYREVCPGRASVDLVPEIVRNALAALPIPKRMRWGNFSAEFVRPVHWVVLLLGEQVITADILGVTSGHDTRGHRFHHPQPIAIPVAGQYASLLEHPGRVMPVFSQRRSKIRILVEEAAEELQGQALIDDALLDEVTGLVEWPVSVTGGFPAEFLRIPQEAIVAVMQGHQKYFPVVDSQGKLLANFITISNIESTRPEVVKQGNERVILPRLSDAAFFWEQDRARSLESRLEDLKKVVFEQRLGTLYDKAKRLAKLAGQLAVALGQPETLGVRAGQLCKCDLLTQMVGEFPELQGCMGEYYARHDQENPAVAVALREQYMPCKGGAQLPDSPLGQALALADRLDTLVGIFGIGQAPSGDKDPYGLRRAAIGILRICIEQQLPLDLAAWIEASAATYPQGLLAPDSAERVFDFCLERIPRYSQEQGIPPDVIDAVLSCRPRQPLDAALRLQGVLAFRALPAAEALAAANKRIHNILKKNQDPLPDSPDPTYFQEAAERALYDQLQTVRTHAEPFIQAGNYAAALAQLAELRQAVDQFFDQVMVMAEDAQVRNNRLALLQALHALFLRVADVSRLQS